MVSIKLNLKKVGQDGFCGCYKKQKFFVKMIEVLEKGNLAYWHSLWSIMFRIVAS